MGWYKIKIRPADTKFSQYIRQRDKMLCQYNFKCYKGTQGSQTSHCFKRRHESVRFDPDNCDWCCASCHNFVENHPDGQKTLEEWKKKQLGEQGFNRLLLRKFSYKKKDDKLAIMYIKELMKSL